MVATPDVAACCLSLAEESKVRLPLALLLKERVVEGDGGDADLK